MARRTERGMAKAGGHRIPATMKETATMTQPKTDGTARFHFDPEYDVSRTPSLDDFISWLKDSTQENADEGLPRAACIASRIDDQRPYVVRLLTSVLGIGRRGRRKAERACIAWAMPEIRRIHEIAREFDVDPRSHELSDIVKSMVTIVIYDRSIERASRLMPNEELVLPDTEKALAPSWTALRSRMESEALANIMDSTSLRSEWPRMIAALRASREEIADVDMRDRIDEVVEHVERTMSRRD